MAASVAPASASEGALSFLPEAYQAPAKRLGWLVGGSWLLYLARPFSGLLLTVFVLSFVAQSFINNALRLLRSPQVAKRVNFGSSPNIRRILVAVFYIGLVAAIAVLAVGTVPRLIADSQYLLRVSESDDPYVFLANTVRNVLGDDATRRVENFLIWREQGLLPGSSKSAAWSGERSQTFVTLLSTQLKGPVQEYLRTVVSLMGKLASSLTSALVSGVIALLFSFLIMWDLPKLSAGVGSIGRSRRRWAKGLYAEVAPQLTVMGEIVGKSFEAQALIAIVNTILTTLGMLLLGLRGVVFLALFVLLCSFVPVAGFILSTVPMAVVALSEYGIGKMLLVLLMVFVVHLFEAYVANPRIYSELLELHPIVVLTALYGAEHYFGPKGMLLAVPFAEYMVEEVIMGRSMSDDTGSEQALEGDSSEEETPFT